MRLPEAPLGETAAIYDAGIFVATHYLLYPAHDLAISGEVVYNSEAEEQPVMSTAYEHNVDCTSSP